MTPFTSKEQLTADTPLLLFDCTMSDGTVKHWSSQSVTWNSISYEPRVLKYNLFEAQMASDTQVGGAPKLTFELANADSEFSEIEQQLSFKGAQLVVSAAFFNLSAETTVSSAIVVFRGLLNPPELITETSFRLSAMNRLSMQLSVVPNVRVERMCAWRFPTTPAQRLEAVDGGALRGKYSQFYRCGYSPDQANGTGNLDGVTPFTSCSYSRSDCEQRGMFLADTLGRATGRFGGFEYVPPTIDVRGYGQKNWQLSAVQSNTASYNDFVPLIYGTQWHVPDVVFSRNDGNLTRMEILLSMGEIEGIVAVLVNDIQIPMGVAGANMTSTGWWSLVTAGTRNGAIDANFTGSDPYGSIACLSIVVPNRINDGTSIPAVQVLMQGLKLWQFDTSGNRTEAFSSNPAWILLDLLMRIGYTLSEISTASFATAAAYCDQLLTVNDPVGGTVQLPRFQCNFALKMSQSAGQIIRSIRNGSQVYLVLNANGLIEARIENTFALQQPALPPGSNATNQFNGGWPAYEFDATSIARASDGSASVKVSRRGAQSTPNRLSVEFQDSFNQYQQDSLSLADEPDIDLCGQEVASVWDAVGISTFTQASRALLLGLNRGLSGNFFIEFQTSVKALGLAPGDLITVTYAKENLERTPFRITKIAPGASFRTATITAQFHDDDWYTDTPTTITGGIGVQTGRGSGLPAPICGTVPDAYGALQLGVMETETMESDGSAAVTLGVSFAKPSGLTGSLAGPLLGLNPVVSTTSGTLAGATNYFYAISAIDASGGEGALSFIAQANTLATTNTNSVTLDGILLPLNAVSFNVYRGLNTELLLRIASAQSPANTFMDTGFAPLAVLPPDPQFDHVDLNWRWELLPETAANIHSASTIGNTTLVMVAHQYQSAVVRITRGMGAGQEHTIADNTATTLTINGTWLTTPDATSWFAIAENSWRSGTQGANSPLSFDVPERIGAGVHISARAANAADEQADYSLSPLTRWILGQSGALAADFAVPPAPEFVVGVSVVQGGTLVLGEIGFAGFANTTGITSGTYTFHYYDELNGPAVITLTGAVAATDTALPVSFSAGTLIQIEQEIILIGATSVTRGHHGTSAAAHMSGTSVYVLSDETIILPFSRNFFGSPASGDWQYNLSLPDVRLASVELFMTNSLGAGATTVNPYTGNLDNGLRTLAGGQLSFQITGYLGIQTNAAPSIVLDTDRSIRDIFALLGAAPVGSGVTLQLNKNGVAWASLSFAAGATLSSVVDGFGLPVLRGGSPGDVLSLNVTGVGSTNPGSDLTLIVRL